AQGVGRGPHGPLAPGDRRAVAILCQRRDESRDLCALEARRMLRPRAGAQESEREQDEPYQREAAADHAESHERTVMNRDPGMERDQPDHDGAQQGEGAGNGETRRQGGIAALTLDFALGPTDLPIEVRPDEARQPREHQLRARAIMPMMTPTNSAPA